MTRLGSTAEVCAAFRTLAGVDPLAPRFLRGAKLTSLARVRPLRPLLRAVSERLVAGAYAYETARTLHLDELVEAELRVGCSSSSSSAPASTAARTALLSRRSKSICRSSSGESAGSPPGWPESRPTSKPISSATTSSSACSRQASTSGADARALDRRLDVRLPHGCPADAPFASGLAPGSLVASTMSSGNRRAKFCARSSVVASRTGSAPATSARLPPKPVSASSSTCARKISRVATSAAGACRTASSPSRTPACPERRSGRAPRTVARGRRLTRTHVRGPPGVREIAAGLASKEYTQRPARRDEAGPLVSDPLAVRWPLVGDPSERGRTKGGAPCGSGTCP